MTSSEIIAKGEQFATELAAKLSDPEETAASKQVYFMDNHERIQKIMGALNQVVSSVETAIVSPGGEISEEDENILQKAKKIITDMKETITEFQKSLIIDENADVNNVPALTEQTMAMGQTNNKGAQRMLESLEAASSMKVMPFNYALYVDGKINLLHADTKDELNNAINDIVSVGTCKDVYLYQLQATPVPLKKKTILTV